MRNRQNRQGTPWFMSTIRERNKELILRQGRATQA
jgi:TetR/AcrR family transcriptional regulator